MNAKELTLKKLQAYCNIYRDTGTRV